VKNLNSHWGLINWGYSLMATRRSIVQIVPPRFDVDDSVALTNPQTVTFKQISLFFEKWTEHAYENWKRSGSPMDI